MYLVSATFENFRWQRFLVPFLIELINTSLSINSRIGFIFHNDQIGILYEYILTDDSQDRNDIYTKLTKLSFN